MPQTATASRAAIPSVDRMLNHPRMEAALSAYGRSAVTDAIRTPLAALRRRMAEDAAAARAEADPAAIAARVDAVLDALHRPSLKRVFNLTGTVLHTNLGRAPMPQAAIDAMIAAAGAWRHSRAARRSPIRRARSWGWTRNAG